MLMYFTYVNALYTLANQRINNLHVLNMVEKVYTTDIIENDAFRKYAHLFLEQPVTALEVEKRSKVTRQTIIKQLKQLDQYIIQPKWSPHIKGKPFQIDTKLIADYLSNKLNLETDEKEYLTEILHNEDVSLIITKNNESIEDALSKTILTILLIGVIRYHFSGEKHASLSFVDSLFGAFLRTKQFNNKLKKSKNKQINTDEVQILSTEDIKVVYSSIAENESEFNNYEKAIRKYAKSESNEFDAFDKLLNKLRYSQMQIITFPNIWYEIFSFTIEPSLHYTNYLQRRYKAKWAYDLKHASPKEKRRMLNIERQLNKSMKKAK